WGANSPDKRKALRQLSVSERITEASQNESEEMFYNLETVVEDGFKEGILRKQPISFLGGVINALADMVLQKASEDSVKLDQYKSMGWEALWGAIARR
ncbi:hypothetical protein K0U00_44000, partial [Paenibacillus sepulcri]|nr:hypothetical protein [Paenibacillus sepulcri]